MSARVLIAGGGVAGVEAAVALADLAGDAASVTICAPREDFVFRPFAVAEAYRSAPAMSYRLADLADRCGAEFRCAGITAVEAEAGRALTRDREEIPFDRIVIACGARLLAGVDGAITFWGVAGDGRVRDVIESLREGSPRLAVTMPAGGSWALPIYELALLARRELDASGGEAAGVVVVTPEDAPLGIFGIAASEAIHALFEERGIELVTGATPVRFADGRLETSPGGAAVRADAVLSLPRFEGRRIDGVPHGDGGFVVVDEHGRVAGLRNGFAAGDVTNFPVKQGGIAAQQADAVAEAIAAELGREIPAAPFDPVLRGVLWTGEEPLYLSGKLTGGHGETSRVSSEPLWDGGADQKIVSRYLAPFLAGAERLE